MGMPPSASPCFASSMAACMNSSRMPDVWQKFPPLQTNTIARLRSYLRPLRPLREPSSVPKKPLPETRNAAWLGDAVLSLYVREWILREYGAMDGERLTAFTSNQFLSAFGNPTEVEAAIGRIYKKDGLAAAFAEIESRLLPVFLSQEKRRARERR